MPHALETLAHNHYSFLITIVICIVFFAVCYRKEFGIKGYGFGQGGAALLSGDIGER